MTAEHEDSYDYVLELLYDDGGTPKAPTKMDNLYQTIQNLVLIYKRHPEWPQELKTDMMQYVDKCTDLLEKN
jgi:hypothetical protein